MIDERKLHVLRAIVEEFVSSHEPIGSKAIADRHVKGVSPATIRNDMAALEDEGYIVAPHTSAGRIPTDKGYRLFVDKLSEVKPLSHAERSAISTFMDQAVDLDDVMLRTTKLLAQLTHQVAIVQYPSLQLSAVRHIELVTMPARRVMVVVIADSGRVEQRMVEVPQELGAVTLEDLRQRLNRACEGVLFVDVPAAVADLVASVDVEARASATAIVATLLESLIERPEERIVVAGAAQLMKREADYGPSLAPLLEALEENVVLLKLLGEAAHDDLQIRIGSENVIDALLGTSVVSTGYGSQTQTVARLGVVGPTHMNYVNSIAAVSAVARYVGRIVTEA
ncbi:MAG: heat-inducible transcriptional repressor HrcA [Actinomycetota bacterium]|jgi:heat-inducible transcriptional repressor